MVRKQKKKTTQKKYNGLPKRRHDPGAPQIVIVDGMNIAYQAFYAYKKLSHKGKSTAILYGFLQILKDILTNNGFGYKAKKVIIAWDGERDPKRMQLLPGYKSHRSKNMTPEQRTKFHKQVRALRKLLFYAGVIQARSASIEGDDMVYILTNHYSKMAGITIVSGDKDMEQLMNRDVQVYNPRKKSGNTYCQCGITNYGLGVHQLVDFYCLTGDDSDDIPGYYGIGPARAAKFLLQFGSIKAFLDDKKASFAGVSDKEDLAKIYKRNRLMMDLKAFHEKYYPNRKIRFYKKQSSPDFQEIKYKTLAMKYNLKTMIFPKFIEFLKTLNNE